MNVSFLSADFVAKRKSARGRWPCFAAVVALLFVGVSNQAPAQSQSWRSENTAGNLLNGTAWWNGSNATTMVFGQQEFDNNVQKTMTNNNGASTFNTWRWLFKAAASEARTITGDALRFFDSGGSDPQIINQSAATHVLNVPVSGDGDSGDPFQIWLDSTGGLTLGSTVNNQGGTIEIQGTALGAKTVTFNGIVSGSGGMFVNNANATVLFDAANSFAGQLTINAGTVRLNGSGDTFGASTQAIRIGTGASLNLNGVSTTVGSVGEESTGDGGTISLGGGTLTIGGSATTFQNSITGAGGITHTGSGTLNLYGSQGYSGTTSVSAGLVSSSVAMSSASYSITGTGTFSTTTANVILDTATVALADTGSLSLGGNDTIDGLSGTGGTVSLSDKTLTTSSGSDTTYSGVISGTGGQLTKSGNGKLNLSGGTANTFTGLTTVSGGTLELSKTAGVNAIAGAVAVNSGAVLLLSASNQINNDAAVSLSGGTIRRGSGVTETFGALTLGAASTLDFGAGTTNSLNFGTYTGGGFKLNVTNFLQGNILTFKNDLSGSINNTSLFGFDNGFTSSWNSGASTFTITAIPEPSTYLAAAGLFALFLWPIRRRLLKDAKFLLGLRPTGRA